MRLNLARLRCSGKRRFPVWDCDWSRTGSSKFDKYLRPMNRTEMDFIALETNVNTIHESLPKADGISIPEVYVNYKGL
jgi:hypothetical protein